MRSDEGSPGVASSQEGQLCQVTKGHWFLLAQPRGLFRFPSYSIFNFASPLSLFSQESWLRLEIFWTILNSCSNFLLSGQSVALFPQEWFLFSWLDRNSFLVPFSRCQDGDIFFSTGLLLLHGSQCFWPIHSTFGWVFLENTLLLALSVLSNGQKLNR